MLFEEWPGEMRLVLECMVNDFKDLSGRRGYKGGRGNLSPFTLQLK